MEIRPILSTLSRHKTAAALIVLEIALTCAILCNALFLVTQRLETLNLPSGIDDEHLIMARADGIGEQVDADARSREDLAALRAVAQVLEAVMVLAHRRDEAARGEFQRADRLERAFRQLRFEVGQVERGREAEQREVAEEHRESCGRAAPSGRPGR